MHRRTLTTLALLLSLSGCAGGGDTDERDRSSAESENGTLRLESPAAGALIGQSMVRVAGTAEIEAPSVMVNGVETPVVDGHFATMINAEEGAGRVTVSVLDLSVAADFEVDTKEPEIEITSPGPVAFVDGERLRVEGRVEEANLDTLLVDGDAVQVAEDGTFRHEARVRPGGQRVRVVAKDKLGREGYAYAAAVVGTFQATEAFLEDGLVVSAGQSALDELARGAASILGEYDLDAMLRGRNPASEAWWGTVDGESEDHDAIEATLLVKDDRLRITLSLVNPSAHFTIHAGILGDYGMDVVASRMNIQSELMVTVVEGVATATVQNTWVEWDGFEVMIEWVPEFIESMESLKGNVRGKIESSLMEAVNESVPEWLSATLNDLALETTYRALGADANLSAHLTGIEMSEAEGVRLRLDTTIRPEIVEREVPGYLVSGLEQSALSTADFNVGVSVDMLNAALFTAWSGGILDYVYEGPPVNGRPLDIATLSAFLPSLRTTYPADAIVSLEMDPVLPPTVLPNEQGRLVFRAPDIRLIGVITPDGERTELFEISISGQANIEVVVREGNIELEMHEVTATADAVRGPRDMPSGPILDEIVPQFIEAPAEMLFALPKLPLPSFYGFRMEGATPSLDRGYLNVSSYLTYSPE